MKTTYPHGNINNSGIYGGSQSASWPRCKRAVNDEGRQVVTALCCVVQAVGLPHSVAVSETRERDGEFAIGRLVISPVQPCRHTDHGTATKLHFLCACVKCGQWVGTDVLSLKNVVNIEEYTRQFTDMLKVTGTKGFNSPLKINLENNR